ncbi:MAG: AF1514 family protein [Desulfobulbaceae bacterium]|nr:AF1514 family protein [Desulfobulbaceae bacterium]
MLEEVKEIKINISGADISQQQAQKIAHLLAERDHPETFVVSRYNRLADACSPCTLGSDIGDKPGWEVYGENHGGRLKISVNDGDYVFIFS